MDLQQLRIVVAVADCGSISAAARRLYTGQPGLSKSIRELEAELGCTLFRRTARGVELTQSGRDFVTHARSIVSQVDAVRNLYRPARQEAPRLFVCAPRASYAAAAFYRWASGAARGPFRFQYRETTGFAALDAVAQEEAQIAVVRYPSARSAHSEGLVKARGLHLAPLWSYRMQLLVSCDHPLVQHAGVTVDDLAPFPEVAHGGLTHIAPPEEHDAAHAAGRVLVYDRAGEFEALRSIAGSYMWVSPMPACTLAREGLASLPCADAALYRDTAVWKGRQTPEAAAFLEEVRREIASLTS
ncbi:MAG TPA: LysR family transcriptional regulator [Candidatus Ruthenibacterium merdigallinarum]|nr:LysR family transcriptional regulator [Candidatus Ruthenibacterium merdigallinarum]